MERRDVMVPRNVMIQRNVPAQQCQKPEDSTTRRNSAMLESEGCREWAEACLGVLGADKERESCTVVELKARLRINARKWLVVQQKSRSTVILMLGCGAGKKKPMWDERGKLHGRDEHALTLYVQLAVCYTVWRTLDWA